MDRKRTSEYDKSQLGPHILYYLKGEKMRDENAYGRVFDGEHRGIVKNAFNAMIESSKSLTKYFHINDITIGGYGSGL